MELDFNKGVISNRSPHDAPQVCSVFENVQALASSILQVRKGMKPLTASNQSGPSANEVISMYGFSIPSGEHVIYLDSAGNLRAGKDYS